MTQDDEQAATVVLVHGAAHGAWAWERVLPGMADAGVTAVAIDLPGQGDDPGPIGDLYGDAARVGEVLDGIARPVVLVGHSYGGAVITEAGTHPSVARLVYIAALALDTDESAAGCTATGPQFDGLDTNGRPMPSLGSAFVIAPDRLSLTIDPAIAAAVFYEDCADADAAWALGRLGRQSLPALRQHPHVAAWRTIPSTYVVCTADRSVHPGLQRRLAERCTDSIEWPTGHSPFLARPELVVDLLVGIARRTVA